MDEDKKLTEALEEEALWGVIHFLEDRLTDLDEKEKLTKEEKLEYDEKQKRMFELLDMVEKYEDE